MDNITVDENGNIEVGETGISTSAGTINNDDTFSIVWNYLLNQIFLFLLLAGAIKGSDQAVQKIFGT